MKNALRVFVPVLFFVLAFGASAPSAFAENALVTQLNFTTSPQTITAGATSTILTTQTQNVGGTLEQASTTTLHLSSTSGTGQFSESNGVPVTTLTISNGSANRSFYYVDSTPGTYTLTVTAQGKTWTPATQTITITAPTQTVSSASSVADINVANGTALSAIGLPANATVTLSDNTTPSYTVAWDGGSPVYSGTTAGTYVFTGTLTIPSGVTNPGNVTTHVSVNVAAPDAPNYTTIFGSVKTTLSGQGIDTNIDTCASTPAACTGLYFEKTDMGKISFAGSLDLTNSATQATLQSLNTGISFSDGQIKFDAQTGDAFKTLGGQLEMYGLAFPDGSTPTIFVDGEAATPSDVSNVAYISGTLTFDASHFSTFSTQKVVNTTTGTGYDTIQAAVSDASPDDIINVAAGTYTENVTISTPLTLQGTSGANLTGSITIASDSVTVDGMNITNPGGTMGIYVSQSNTVNITNNTLHGIGGDSVVGAVQAINVHEGSSNVTIQGNTIYDITSAGNQGSGHKYSAKGIYLGDSSGSSAIATAIIDDNTIYNIVSASTTPAGRWGAYGILVNRETTGLQVTNNKIHDLDGLWAHGIGLEGNTPSATVTGNTITGLTDHKTLSDAVGINLEDNPAALGASALVSGNTFSSVAWKVADKVSTSTILVSPTWTNAGDLVDAGNGIAHAVGTNAFSTIQAGVNAVASGGTINVAAGNYGSVTLSADKVVTINGAQAGVDARSGRPAASESVVKMQVTAGDVTLDGFTFDADGSGNALEGLYLALGTHNNLVVKNSVLENGDFGLNLPSNTLLPSFTADKNYFLNNSNDGNTANQLWAISPDTTTKVVTNNKFTGNDNADININWGNATVSGNESENDATLLVAVDTTSLSVTGNSGTFNGNGTAIFIGKGNHSVTVSGNNLSDAIRGVKFSNAFGTGGTTAAVVTGNTITNSTDSGIYVQNGSYSGAITIDNNVIQGSTVPAVFFETDSGVTASGSEVMNNSFADATIGITWPDSGTLNGTKNYWNTGATNPSSKTATSSAGDINVSPWYTNAAMTTLSDNTGTNATYTSTTDGQADMPTGATAIVLTGTTVLDLSNATTSAISTVTIGVNTVDLTQSVTLQSGTEGAPIVLTNSALEDVSVSILDGTTISGPAGWDGTITPPISGTPEGGDKPAGFSVGGVVINVGSPDGTLVFDLNHPVTLLLAGVTGVVGYRPSGSDTWTQITNTCGGDYTTPTAPSYPNECAINNGTNTKIVTFHFTSFGEFIPDSTPTPPYHHGSSRAVPAIPATPAVPGVSPAVPATPSINSNGNANGRVLGAAVYNFTKNLTVGSRGADVTALQQFLIDGGFTVPSGATGYFGKETRAAVIAFQKARGIAQVGNVGPLTRGELNKGVTPTATNLTSVQADAILSLLESFGADASVVAKVRASLGR